MVALWRFLRDARGSQTIEFVLWMPIIVALLVIVIDAATLYLTHTEMWNVARDTARRMTSGNFRSEAAAENYAAGVLGDAYRVDATYDPNGSMEVVIELHYESIWIPGWSVMTIFGGDMIARVSMRSDPTVTGG